MGAFYGSVHVRCDDRKRVVTPAKKACLDLGVKCFVAPACYGWVSIYFDDQGQDHRPAEAIARATKLDVLQLIVHDDDVFMYNFYRDGIELDCYTSSPGYFSQARRAYELKCTGKPPLFKHLLRTKTSAFKKILGRKKKYLFEGDRLREVAKLFRIANADTCYESLIETNSERAPAWKEFLHLPNKRRLKKKKADRVEVLWVDDSLQW